jgi:hypothetical protein
MALGHRDREALLLPKPVELDSWYGKRVMSVACGKRHTAAILSDGTLFTFGDGSDGQLGHRSPQQLYMVGIPPDPEELVPKRLELDAWLGKRVVSISCGSSHTAAVLDDGTLYTFGSGNNGRLGHGDEEDRHEPTRVNPGEWHGKHVLSVACGAFGTAVVLDDGELFTFGYSGIGEMQLVPKRVEVDEWRGKRVVLAVCSDSHIAVVLDDGSLYTFGEGGRGQLGHNDYDGQAPLKIKPGAWRDKCLVSVAHGNQYTAAVLDDQMMPSNTFSPSYNVMNAQKLPVVITILNELWSVAGVRQYEHQFNSVQFLQVVDQLVRLYKRLFKVARALEEQQEQEGEQEETSKYPESSFVPV